MGVGAGIKVASAPLLFYGVFFSIRLMGFQPPAEAGMGEFITAVHVLFGASIAYFVFALGELGITRPVRRVWWWLMSLFLALLAFDEIYMIHENVSARLRIDELPVFLTYALILVVLVMVNRAELRRPLTMAFLGAFVLLSGIAVGSDTLLGEGDILLFGRSFGVEQLSESLSVLFLSCALVPPAIAELRTMGEASPT